MTESDHPDRIPQEILDGPELVYEIVAARIVAKIDSGEWRPGRRLPGERQLAADFGVAYLSVRRAIATLREQGRITTIHGKGNFVAAPSGGE
jgi:DNA-binding GntR family transcriptional regulator